MRSGVNNCGEWAENDNGENTGVADYPQYREGHPITQVCNKEQDSPCELEWVI